MYVAEKRKIDELNSRVLALEAEKIEMQEEITKLRRSVQGMLPTICSTFNNCFGT